MSAAIPLLKEITCYLDQLNTDRQKEVLGIVKTFAPDDLSWNDKNYRLENNITVKETKKKPAFHK